MKTARQVVASLQNAVDMVKFLPSLLVNVKTLSNVVNFGSYGNFFSLIHEFWDMLILALPVAFPATAKEKGHLGAIYHQ